jgi:hypothetical protein
LLLIQRRKGLSGTSSLQRKESIHTVKDQIEQLLLEVIGKKKIIGKKNPLVFFETKSQNSHENKKENKKTEWTMYEYQVHDPTASKQNKRKADNDMRVRNL